MKNIPAFATLESLWTVLIKLNTVTGKPVVKNEYYQACENLSQPNWFDRLMLKTLPKAEPERSRVLQQAIDLAKTPHCGKLFTYIEEDLGPDVEEALLKQGFQLLSVHAGMAYVPSAKDLEFEDPRIRLIGPGDLPVWCDVRTRGFQKPTPMEVHEKMLLLEGNRYYALEEKGKMLSVGMLCIDKDAQNPGLQSIATPPENRGKHLASAIVRRIMKEAAEESIPLLTLQASKLGEPVYAKLGFERLGTIKSFIFKEE